MTEPEAPPARSEPSAISSELALRIREEIAARGGTIPFSRFMELCLYAPGLGYYRNTAPKFGAGGDFVTAPEISDRFGTCLARQVEEVLRWVPDGVVVEAGGGNGRLAVQVLRALAERDLEPPYLMLEPSAELRRRQAERLQEQGLGGRVQWLDDFPAPGLRGAVVANEVIDALPASRLEVTGGAPREAHVGWRDGAFHLEWRAPSPTLARTWEAIRRDLEAPLPPGYLCEVHLAAPAWVEAMGARIERGLLLLIDYGYPRRELYHPERSAGTLACHYRHRVHHDPFFRPGLQDLSTHVDFTALARAGEAAGLELSGFTTQAEFLLATGLLEHGAGLAPESEAYMRFAQEVKRLTLPAEMGEAVKVLALSRGIDGPLIGFTGRDHRPRLQPVFVWETPRTSLRRIESRRHCIGAAEPGRNTG